MNKIISFFFILITFQGFTQSKTNNEVNTAADPQLTRAINDTTITVTYIENSKLNKGLQAAYFVNGQFTYVMDRITPDMIDNINVEKKDTTISGIKFSGTISIQLKDDTSKKNYVPKIITLNDLKNNYTKLKNQPALFTIDGQFINADYTLFLLDRNNILKIIVEKFAAGSMKSQMWVINILTKTKENIDNTQRIMIKGIPTMKLSSF